MLILRISTFFNFEPFFKENKKSVHSQLFVCTIDKNWGIAFESLGTFPHFCRKRDE